MAKREIGEEMMKMQSAANEMITRVVLGWVLELLGGL